MDDKLTGNYNLIICNECGAAAGIIFYHLVHSDHVLSNNGFFFNEIKKEMVFIKQRELWNGLGKLINCGYICGSQNGIMDLSFKSNVFIKK